MRPAATGCNGRYRGHALATGPIEGENPAHLGQRADGQPLPVAPWRARVQRRAEQRT